MPFSTCACRFAKAMIDNEGEGGKKGKRKYQGVQEGGFLISKKICHPQIKVRIQPRKKREE